MKKHLSLLALIGALPNLACANTAPTPQAVQPTQTKSTQIDYVEFSFTDLLGNSKSILKPLHSFEKDMQNGIAIDGSSIFGCSPISESDMLLKPDLEAVTQLPWTNSPARTARVTCDIYKDERTPHAGDPRYILKQTLDEAAALGYDFLVGPELEFFIFKEENGKRVPYDSNNYCASSNTITDDSMRAMLLTVLQAVGIPVEKLHHEVAPGQYEVSIAYNNALKMADFVVMAKHTLKALLASEKLEATFMPKPLGDKNGSGMHIHFSLWDKETAQNLFYNPQDQYRLSSLAKSFIAGVLYHAPALTLIFNPTVNSYKRLVPGFEAPIYICCGQKNRSALIRLPETGDHASAIRAEIRSPDGHTNPYLAFAGILKAGLDGIANNRTLPEIFNTNLYRISAQALEEKGISTLPHSFETAINVFASSELMQDLLGATAHAQYVQAKRKELHDFNATITDWEYQKYC
ncbi:MAG: glutamine synthetase family protein [Candidatus Babeliales bacterium]